MLDIQCWEHADPLDATAQRGTAEDGGIILPECTLHAFACTGNAIPRKPVVLRTGPLYEDPAIGERPPQGGLGTTGKAGQGVQQDTFATTTLSCRLLQIQMETFGGRRHRRHGRWWVGAAGDRERPTASTRRVRSTARTAGTRCTTPKPETSLRNPWTRAKVVGQ